MGYNTDYSLRCDVEEDSEIWNQLIARFAKRFDEKDATELLVGQMNHTWYSYEDDMTTISKEFPDVCFHLKGKGESKQDRWQTVYYNGNSMKVPTWYEFLCSKLNKELVDSWKKEYSDMNPFDVDQPKWEEWKRELSNKN